MTEAKQEELDRKIEKFEKLYQDFAALISKATPAGIQEEVRTLGRRELDEVVRENLPAMVQEAVDKRRSLKDADLEREAKIIELR